MQQYHYHLIRDERDASIMEEPPASKVKWPSPGQFMMNKLWLAFMSSSKLLWTKAKYDQRERPRNTNTAMTRGWGQTPPWWSLQCNHESVLLRDHCANFTFTIGSWAEHKGSEADIWINFLCWNFFYPLIVHSPSAGRESTLETGPHGRGEEERLFGECPFSLFCGRVKRFFLPWYRATLLIRGTHFLLPRIQLLRYCLL